MFGLPRGENVQSGSIIPTEVRCTIPDKISIRILPSTEEIKYDFSKHSSALNAVMMQSGKTLAPDSATGGLREDRPEYAMRGSFGSQTYPLLNSACLWFKEITVEIKMKPQIYIASELNHEHCVKTILEHELTHVKVDRETINEFTPMLYKALEKTVLDIGAVGPVGLLQIDETRDDMSAKVSKVLTDWFALLEAEIGWRQQQVDSQEEYARISRICHGSF